jgi:hypothetical protein
MELEKDNGEWLEIFVRSYKPKIKAGYELKQSSSKQYFSIDRGITTDEYSADLSFRGEYSQIEELIIAINELKNNLKSIKLRNVNVALFGDHIDYSGILECAVTEISVQETADVNVMKLDVTLMLSSPVFKPVIPRVDLVNSYNSWSGGVEWDYVVNTTHNGDIFSNYLTADTYLFKGKYMLNKDTTYALFSDWLLNIRGRPFDTTSSEWGVSKMFGATLGENHKIIIKSIDIEIISSYIRDVSVEIVRQGDYNGKRF